MCQIFTSPIGTSLFGRKEALRGGGSPAQNKTLLFFLIHKKLPPLNPIHMPPQHTPIPVCTLGREKH